MPPQLVIICGPTATGKTRLGVALAKALGGEVVSADSMQVYRDMAIGTARPVEAEMEGIPHHMMAVADPTENFSVARYVAEATPIVDDILAEKGSVISGGTPLISVRLAESKGGELKGILYIPVAKGKRVQSGQTIQLVPNGVDVSQTGSLLGTVRSVSQYPVTPQSMQKTLGNEQLAQWILRTQQSAVMEVSFDLVKDPGSESGYLWTSSVGEHKPITAGSFCTGSIIIERRPPIEKVFYKLSQWLRNR